MTDDDTLSLGERLLAGVQNLWRQVNSQGKVLDQHGHEIEAMRRDLAGLKKQVQGLKVSRGKALAKNSRLQKMVDDAESDLQQINDILN